MEKRHPLKNRNFFEKKMIVGYVRVSTEKQHPENQKEEINRYAIANCLTIDRWRSLKSNAT